MNAVREDNMSGDLRGRIERLREQLEELRREIRFLNHEERRAPLIEMRNAAFIIEQTISDIEHREASSTNKAAPNDFNMPFDTWFKQEIRMGVDYGSVADAADHLDDGERSSSETLGLGNR